MKRLWTIIWFWMLGIVAGGTLWAQSGSGFYVEPGGTMTVENNIIIYNTGQNINVSVSSYNAVTNATNILENVETDFRLRGMSPVLNIGNNLYVTWLHDLMDTLRIINDVVDLGAFEYPVWARAKQYAVHQVEGSELTFCNNIIVNNPEHYAATNATTIPIHNILSDSIPVVKDAVMDFSLTAASPAVDAGQNSCNNTLADLRDSSRVFNNTIDIGAFEYIVPQTFTDTTYTVWQNNLGSLSFCNNIDINNCIWSINTNITTSSSNIVTDNDSLFMDNVDDYMPRPESEAVDAGHDDCNSVEKDLADKQRVMGSQIDIGAFEQYVENEDSIGVTYAVHQISGHTLNLCNNVIVNNPEHHDVTNIAQVPDNNILSDSIPIFSDAVLNFKPYYSSPAVDAGDNSCNTLAKDIDTVTRISGPAIDIGAFELPVRNDSTYAGGGGGGYGGGGGGYGGGGGGYGAFYHTTVHQHDGDSLVLCNNIIINNCWLISNAYEDADTVCNILTDTDSLFTDNRDDYMPRPESQAVNTGCNDCNEVSTDLSKKDRIYQEIIDIGAFEQYAPEDTSAHHNIVVHQVGSGTLQLCNNVIVNNLAMELATNIEDIPDNNILSDSIPIFCDALNNFALWSHSPAVDAGSNSCCELPEDLKDDPRISNDTIDIGAFEFRTPHVLVDTTFAVLQHEGETLTLCNNIVINNTPFTPNTNIEDIPDNNIVEDNDSVFTDNRTDFMPLPQSIAVNQGDNLCNTVAVDLAKHTRIMADTIDIGAFEQFVDEDDTFYAAAVIGDTLHQLLLYNNIIINNPGHIENVNGNVSGDHNLTQDMQDVFADASSNFNLILPSPAVDAGDNQRITLSFDIKDDPRVACGNIVDQGAFEFKFSDEEISVMASEIPTDNCQGYYIQLTATAGAQHYYWLHTNEDTNVVQVSPLIPTEYTVITSNGGECVDTASVYVIPSSMMSDTLGSPASIGTTFWLSYLRNHFQEPTLTLQVSAEEACTGTVSNPQTGWSTSFNVAAHSVTVVSIPVAAAYPTASDQVGNFGLLVQTSDSVSLYAANYNTSSFDVTNVLPVDALSDEYVLQTYTPMMNAEFVVVATVDNTVVDITPSRALQGGHAAQQTFSVTLQAGQTYWGMSQFGGILGDLSGTLVRTHDNKPVAVFNGNVCALVPSDNSYTDHLVEQAVGVNYWGRSFAITATENQNFDVVRVTAQRNNTQVKKNGVLITTLQAYQTHEFQLNGTSGSCYIETSEPAGVYLYIAGAMQGNAEERSDPSMIWIPPTEQKLNDLTFATFNSPGITDHYVNIVIPTIAANDVTLDGVNIGGQFSTLNGNSDFVFVRKHITNGTHTLHCDGGFIAHCYGLGYHESYGYAAGSKAVPLKEQLFVNGILNTELPTDLKFCPYEPITFSVELNYPCDSVVWSFGDGTPTGNGYSTLHDYAAPGTYTVSATLYISSNGEVFCSNLYTRILVMEGPVTTFYDTICQGDAYTSHGFEIETSESGHFTFTRTTNVPGQYCDSTYVLELEVRDNFMIVEDTICLGNLYTDHGFNITPLETRLYTDTLNAGTGTGGCDSLLILQLVVTPNTDNPPTIAGETYPCQGGSYVYSIDSLSGLTNVVWTVPDSVLVLLQPDPYQIELLFATFADSFDISITATGGCGTLSWSKTVYPQAYSFVQLTDTICEYETEYEGYGFSLTGVSDTNSLFIHHGVAAGGCDSTTVLRLVFAPPYQVSDTIAVCANNFPYLYHDTLLADTGTYTVVLSTVHGCDSTVNLTLTAVPTNLVSIDTTVCDSMVWYGITYTGSGTYDTVFTNMNGCDSVERLHLTVHYSDLVSLDSVVCRNELPIVWNGVTFPDAGTDTAILTTVHHCDSTVIMNVIVHELTSDTITAVILENDLPYPLNDSLYYTADTFTQTLTNTAGCDSILTLVLTVLNNETSFVDTAVCEDELPFVWNDSSYNVAGIHTQTLVASSGADSTVHLSLTIKLLTDSVLNITLLENDLPYLLNDSTYGEEGTYTQYFTNAAGCDSTLTLNLTVIPNVEEEVDSVVCESELPLWWNDSLFTEAGTKVTILPASTGADSTVTMTLMVTPTTHATETATACDSLTWIDGVTYTQTPAVAPTYTLTNAAGCDSVVTLHLTLYPSVATEDRVTICEQGLPYAYGDTLFDIGTPALSVVHFALSTIHGCDSLVTLELTVNPSDTTIVTDTACNQYVWFGDTLTQTGEYTHSLENANGCDSTVVLHLTVHYSDLVSLDSVVCRNELPVVWNGITFPDAGTDTIILTTAHHCDSLVVMNVIVHELTSDTITAVILENDLPYSLNDSLYYTADTFTQTLTNTAGCDSILTLVLTVLNNETSFIDTAVCEDELPLVWNDSSYNEAGIHTQTLVASTGADSTVILTLTVIPTTYSTFDTAIVENALPFSYNDSSYNAGGAYTQHFTNAAGCDSLLTLHLTVYPNVTEEVDSTVCANELPVFWNDSVFTEAGTKTTLLTASTGADSTVVMNLYVVPMPVITLSPDTAILPGESVTLWGSGVNILTWTDADGNILGSGNTLTVSPSTSTYYYLSGFNVNDSSDFTTVTNGDFELGNNGFSSDYIYSTGLGPEGRYCIGANAHDYHSGFTGAHDHTSGSGNYMIVNGAGTPNTTVWEQTVNVTPHTNYAFSVWVCTVSPYSAAYLARLQFSINGTQVGEVFQSPLTLNTWSQFYEVWNSGSNTQADIVILNQNTALAGNDFGIDDIHFSPLTTCSATDSVLVRIGQQVDSVVCDDELPVEWNGHTFTEAGSAWAILPDSDNAVWMNLIVHHATSSTLDTAVLENNLPYSLNDSSYTHTGTYTQTLTNAAGCDSVLTIHLTVIPNVTVEVDSTICENALPFTWNGVTFDTAGTQNAVITSSTGADSTVTMTLTVNLPTDSTLHVTVVENDLPLTLNDSTYAGEGTYIQHLTNAAGCDSVLTIELSVLYNVTSQADSTLCADELPLTWNGVTFTQAGTLTAILPAANGADSVITMVLSIKPLSDSMLNVSVVQNDLPYTLNGVDYSATGTYDQHFTNAVGCDSTLTLHLTVYPNVTSQVDTTVCAANMPFTWHGHSFTAAGSHTVTLLTSHGADSVVTYHLSVDNISATAGNVTHITCYGESTGAATATVMGGQSPMTYAWTNASGTNISTTTSIGSRPAGAYTFTVTDHLGCTATTTVTLNTLNGPLAPGTVSADQVVCDGEDVPPFTGTAASGGDNGAYQWQISTNGTDWIPAPGTNNAQNYSYPDPASNNFTLRRAWVSQSCGTVYSNTLTVEVGPNSSDTLTAEVCQGEAYQENGFDITADQTAETGEYTFEQHYATGHCDSAVILLLTVWPQYETELEDVVCEGEGYSDNGFEVSPLETVGAEVLQRTQNLQSEHGCDSIVTLQLTVIDTALRIVPLTGDFCDNMSAELMVVTEMPDYVWSTGETAPTITVTASGYYSVTATEGGCTATAAYRVEGCQFELILPNAITPSDFDGVNDYFALPEFFLRDISLFEIAIFNRWGEMVYYSTDKGFKWNGEYRGEIQYQTIYNYVIKYTDTSGRPFRRTGSVTVL